MTMETRNDKNGEVDLILLLCRARPKFGFAGEASLNLADKVFSRPGRPQITNASGTYQTDCYLFFDTFYNGDDSDLFGNYGFTEITPYTTPNTSTPTIKNTGIAIKNIRYSGKNRESRRDIGR